MEIAQAVGGEIISADSRTIYKGMDVGTAKPSLEEQEGVPHWGFDLVEPGERFTVADWKQYAEAKIEEIRNRGKVPIIVGGTGLYVDALVFDYSFTKDAQKNYTDREKMCAEYKIFGIKWDTEELKERLRWRAEQMFDEELYKETERLVKKYGWGSQAMKSNVYQFAWRYMQGELFREEAVNLSAIDDWHLAKRQMTWFRRNPEIVWLPLEKVYATVLKCIQDEQRK